MLRNTTHRFVVVGRRPGLKSCRWAKTIAEASAIAQTMDGNYSLVAIKRNAYFIED